MSDCALQAYIYTVETKEKSDTSNTGNEKVSYNVQAVQGFIPIHELIQKDEVKIYSCAVAQTYGVTIGATLWFHCSNHIKNQFSNFILCLLFCLSCMSHYFFTMHEFIE